jgi:hypothetical protein
MNLEVGGVRGLDPGEVVRDGGGHLGHGRRAVPEVRVRGAVRQAEQLLHVDDLAPVGGSGVLDVSGPGVVADAVLHDEAGVADLPGDGRARLERVRVGVRVAHDGADLDVLAADLLDHVGVLVLRADGRDRGSAGGGGAARRGGRGRTGGREQGRR